MKEICFKHLLGYCPECKIDMDESHHPNNRDCPDYISYIIQENDEEENGRVIKGIEIMNKLNERRF